MFIYSVTNKGDEMLHWPSIITGAKLTYKLFTGPAINAFLNECCCAPARRICVSQFYFWWISVLGYQMPTFSINCLNWTMHIVNDEMSFITRYFHWRMRSDTMKYHVLSICHMPILDNGVLVSNKQFSQALGRSDFRTNLKPLYNQRSWIVRRQDAN